MNDNERIKEDHKLIETNLKNALEYEKNLNAQLMGRLEVYERIVEKILEILITKVAERR